MAGRKLPFNEIIYYCDGKTLINALCVSTIYSFVYTSDIVKAIARRKSVKYIRNIPKKYVLLFFEHLVSIGADVRTDDDFAVRWASENGHLETVKYLVSVGADIRAHNDYAFRLASSNGHLETVKYLVSIGADIRADYDYAVKWASRNGHLETVKYLVSIGADIRADDELAVRLASACGHLETVKYLVSVGADRELIIKRWI